MKRIRLPVVLLVLWLMLSLSFEWPGVPGPLAPVARWAVPVSALVPLLVPGLARSNAALLVGAVAVAWLALRAFSGAGLGGAALPWTIAEVSALSVSVLLARWLSLGLAEFEQVVTNLAIGPMAERRARQGEIYREIQRARVHQRPLAILVVRHVPASAKVTLERLVLETQQAMREHYLMASISRAVGGALETYNILARRKDHFLIVMPEATAETLAETTAHLRHAIQQQVGVEVRIGAACLPGDALTFEGLVDKAMQAMDTEGGPAVVPGAVALEGLLVQEANHGHVDRQ